MSMKLIDVVCNLLTVKDGRGVVLTYRPEEVIQEFNLIVTHPGQCRGFHMHPEFDEYVLFVSGQGIYEEYIPRLFTADELEAGAQYPFIYMSAGSCIHFPSGCYHTLHAITEVQMIALLTKRWGECKVPITKIG